MINHVKIMMKKFFWKKRKKSTNKENLLKLNYVTVAETVFLNQGEKNGKDYWN